MSRGRSYGRTPPPSRMVRAATVLLLAVQVATVRCSTAVTPTVAEAAVVTEATAVAAAAAAASSAGPSTEASAASAASAASTASAWKGEWRSVAVEEGGEVRLACGLQRRAEECQWSWQRLEARDQLALVVHQFSASGADGRDCSVRFLAAKQQQQGLWTCGVRAPREEGFVTMASVRLVVLRPARFQPSVESVEVHAGEPGSLPCRTEEAVAECRWAWHGDSGAAGKAAHPPEAGRLFPPTPTPGADAGVDARDCSLHLDRVETEHAGRWTCEARVAQGSKFVSAAPIRLAVLQGVKFVELSRDVQANEGEPVALRCVVSAPVERCQWLWRPLDEPRTEGLPVKAFAAGGERRRDCSVRFPAVLAEQQGLWSCAVRAHDRAPYAEAPPATLTLLPPVKLRFLETPNHTSVAVGHSVVLPCVATSAVTDCLWTYHPLNDTEGKGIPLKQFPAFGNYSRDCSLNFTTMKKEQEGYWECSIRAGFPDSLLQADSPLAKVTAFESDPIEFTELSQDIHLPNGSHLFLRCVSSSTLKMCQWTWTSANGTNNSSRIYSSFPANGNGSHDCSMHIEAATEKHEGTWTCGARKDGESIMTMASPAHVTLLKPETVMVALWATPGENVTLACRLSTVLPAATCYWQHQPDLTLGEHNYTGRHVVHHNNETGVCTLVMDPETEDLGQWRCVFTVDTRNGEWELAAATLILLTTNSITDKTMDWIVGVLAGLVLLLTILIVVILVCKQKAKSSKPKEGLGNPTIQAESGKTNPSRYTEAPSKINFQFGDTPVPPTTNLPTGHQPSDSQHIYEPVDRYLRPNSTKSIYENVQ